jgi:hypothetical protein
MSFKLPHIDVSKLKDKYAKKYYGSGHQATYGLAVPFSSNNQGCLCLDGKTYRKNCCGGYLKNQGIGSGYGYGEGCDFSTEFSTAFCGGVNGGGFSNGFSFGFSVNEVNN